LTVKSRVISCPKCGSKTVVYICPKCDREFPTEDEALQCAREDKLNESLCEIFDDPNFKLASENFEVDDVESAEFEITPEDATSIEEVEKVKIIQRVSGWQEQVFERQKES